MFDRPLPAPNHDRVFPTVQSGLVDEVIEVIVSDAPDILERANAKPAPPAKPMPEHATIGDLIERGNPVPASQSPPPRLSQERVLEIQDLVFVAEDLRRALGMGVIMLDALNRPIETVDFLGQKRTILRANYQQFFSITDDMVSIGLPISGLVCVIGPEECRDVFGVDILPPTATYSSGDTENVLRLFKPTMPVPRLKTTWRSWTISSDETILALRGGSMKLPKNSTTPIAALPALIQDRLLNPTEVQSHE